MASTSEVKTRAGQTGYRVPISGDKLLIGLLALTLILTIVQITWGGVVRVTGSGDGCPDWPRCFGTFMPPWGDYHAMTEYAHRFIGSFVGVFIALTAVRVWWKHPDERLAAWTVTFGLVLISAVGLIGGAVVLNDLDPAIRTLHLSLAEMAVLLLAFALIYTTHQAAPVLRLSREPADGAGPAAGWPPALKWAIAAAVLALIALLSGSYAVWRGAGAVCPSWPLCGGPIIPESELVWIHVTHRMLAGTATIISLIAAHKVWRLSGAPRALRWTALAAPAIVLAQVLIGAANPWTNFDEWARAGHLTLATLVWVDMVLMVSLILRPVPRWTAHSREVSTA